MAAERVRARGRSSSDTVPIPFPDYIHVVSVRGPTGRAEEGAKLVNVRGRWEGEGEEGVVILPDSLVSSRAVFRLWIES